MNKKRIVIIIIAIVAVLVGIIVLGIVQSNENQFEGLWQDGNEYYAFLKNGDVYHFTVKNDNENGDYEPERAYLNTCEKGHLDENDNIVFTEEMSSGKVWNEEKQMYDYVEEPMYYYNVFDCKYQEKSKVGEQVFKESSEIIVVGTKKYVIANDCDYMITTEYEPTHIFAN